jgi:hypothetical protein
MTSVQTTNYTRQSSQTGQSSQSRWPKGESYLSSVCTLLGSLLVTMQSQQMNPNPTFDAIQTRADAFVR